MANNTIKGAGDVYQKDLYGDLTMSAEQALTVIQAINKALAEQTKSTDKIINIEAKDIKTLNEVNKGIEEVNQSFEEKIKIDKERLKVQKQIDTAQAADAKQLVDLEVKSKKLSAARNELIKRQVQADKQRRAGNDEIAEAIKLNKEEEAQLTQITKELLAVNQQKAIVNKETKEQIKDSQGLVGAYERESKRLNQLRKDYKNLFLEQGKSTKETKELKREIDKLDRELKDVDESVGQFQRSVGDYPTVVGSASEALGTFAASALSVSGVLAGVQSSLEGTAQGAEELRVAQAKLEGGLDQAKNVASNAVVDFFNFAGALAEGDEQALNLANNVILNTSLIGLFLDKTEDTGEFFDNTAAAAENFDEKVTESVEALAELERRTIAFEKSSRSLEIAIAELSGEIDEQNALAGDSTRGFEEIEAAAVKSQEKQEERSKLLISLAIQERDLIDERVRVANLAGGASVQLLDEQTAAIVKEQEARNDALTERLDGEKLIRENARDRFERELDFAIDAFDAQKTVNERLIADETKNLDQRRAIFDETVRLTDKSFANQVKLLQDFTGEKIDLDALVRESDEEAIRAAVRKFDFDDVTLGRVLEIIKEKKIANQDLADSQRDLNEVDQDAIDLRKDIAAQEEALGKITEESLQQSNEALENLDKDRNNNEIENLRRRLFLAEEGSSQFLQIQKDLNDALLGEQEKRITEQQKAEEAAAKNREEIQKASLGLVEKFVSARSSARQEELEGEIEATEKQQDRLRSLAEKGVLGADQSLAAEEKKQAELERQKQQEIRNQELRTAGFKILSALLEQGKSPQEAIPEVGVLLGALPAVISAIPTFFEGTEDTGKVNRPLDSNGGRLSLLHDNERVIDKKNNMKMGGISNDEAANIVQDYNRGLLGNLYEYNQPRLDDVINTNWKSNSEILSKFQSLESTVAKSNEEVRKAIENKPVVTDVTYKKILNEILITMEENGKIHRTRSKVKKRL